MTQASTLIKSSVALVASFLVLGIWFAVSSSPAHALSCIQPGTVKEELDAAHAVLYGEVTEVLQDTRKTTNTLSTSNAVNTTNTTNAANLTNTNAVFLGGAATATIEVKEWFKGDYGKEIEMILGAYTTWYTVPKVGQEVILYLSAPTSKVAPYAFSMPLCGRSVVGNVDQELKELKAITGGPNPGPQACHQYQVGDPGVRGFGLAYNPRTMELILSASCDASGVEVISDPGTDGYTYQYGYYYHDRSWQRFEYQGRGSNASWLQGKAMYQISSRIAAPGDTLYFVAYTCMKDGRQWYCGCTDKACTDSRWQIQKVEVPKPSTGGGLTFCTADAFQCPDGTYVGRTGPNCQFVCP